VLSKINDNAYKIDLTTEYGVSQTFDASDLSPYFGPLVSRMTPFQEGEDDEEIPTINTTPINNAPITRSHVKQISDQVNANLCHSYNLNLDDMVVLSSFLLLVEFMNKFKESPQQWRTKSNVARISFELSKDATPT
jgi:hypothetical protein